MGLHRRDLQSESEQNENAGNGGDVIKHSVYLAVLDELRGHERWREQLHVLERPDQFAGTVTGKLLAYALGRGLTHADRPTVRAIVRASAADDYRWSALVAGIVKSPAFLMRNAAAER